MSIKCMAMVQNIAVTKANCSNTSARDWFHSQIMQSIVITVIIVMQASSHIAAISLRARALTCRLQLFHSKEIFNSLLAVCLLS